MDDSRKQLVQVPFVLGLDERTQGEHVDANRFQVLENVRQANIGGATKRNGFTPLQVADMHSVRNSSAIGMSRGCRALSINGALAVVDGYHLRTYSETADRWSTIDHVPHAIVSRTGITSAGTSFVIPTAMAYANGYYLYAQKTSNTNTEMVLVDALSGCVVWQGAITTWTSATFNVQLAAHGNSIIAVAHTASTTLKVFALDCTSQSTIQTGLTAGTTVTGTYPHVDGQPYQLVASNDSTAGVVLVWKTDLGVFTEDYAFASISATATVNYEGANTPGSGAIAALAVSLAAGSGRFWVAYSDGTTGAWISHHNYSSSGTLIGEANVDAMLSTINFLVPVVTSATTGYLFDEAGSEMRVSTISIVGTTPVLLGSQSVYNTRILSTPFRYNSRVYALIQPKDGTSLANSDNKCAFLCDFTTLYDYAHVVANIAPRILYSGPVTNQSYIVPNGANGTATKFSFVWAVSRNAITGTAERVDIDFAHQEQWSSAELGGCPHIGGGKTFYSDGLRCTEANFLTRPEKPTGSLGGTGYTGAVRYIVIWERVDSAGNIHWSGLSDPSDVIDATGANANKTITVTVPTMQWTAAPGPRSDGVTRAVFYRTASGPQSTYYRVGTVDNTAGAATISLADNMSDTTLILGQQLYRQISVASAPLNRQCPPGLRFLRAHKDCLVGVGDDLKTIWHSAAYTQGEGVWFSDIFQIPIEEGGRIYGLASMDGRLYAFKRNRIFVIDGDPPSDNGAVGGFAAPFKLPSEVGCIEGRSVVETPVGVFFRSDRGIELLDRGQNVTWVGERVQATLAAYPKITSAVTVPTKSLVLFTCAATESDSTGVGTTGVTLVYDYSSSEWVSVDKVSQDVGASVVPSYAAQSAAMATRAGVATYFRLSANGSVHYEDSTTYKDGASATWITQKATTGWLKAGGLQGRQKLDAVTFLATKVTDHNISFAIDYDYLTSRTQTGTYTRAEIADAVSAYGREQLELPGNNDSEGMSARVTISDVTPTGGTVGTGQGATWIGLCFDVAPLKGRRQLGVQARGGAA